MVVLGASCQKRHGGERKDEAKKAEKKVEKKLEKKVEKKKEEPTIQKPRPAGEPARDKARPADEPPVPRVVVAWNINRMEHLQAIGFEGGVKVDIVKRVGFSSLDAANDRFLFVVNVPSVDFAIKLAKYVESGGVGAMLLDDVRPDSNKMLGERLGFMVQSPAYNIGSPLRGEWLSQLWSGLVLGHGMSDNFAPCSLVFNVPVAMRAEVEASGGKGPKFTSAVITKGKGKLLVMCAPYTVYAPEYMDKTENKKAMVKLLKWLIDDGNLHSRSFSIEAGWPEVAVSGYAASGSAPPVAKPRERAPSAATVDMTNAAVKFVVDPSPSRSQEHLDNMMSAAERAARGE